MGLKYLFKFLLILAICMGLPITAFTATTGKIAGKVVDGETGEALPGVNVVLQGTTMGAATDVDGNYFIINVKPGVYTVVATMIGYKTINQTEVLVNVDRTTRLDFDLQVAVIEGEEVTVVAEREIVPADVSSSQQIISSESVEAMVTSSPIMDISQMINMQAGIENMVVRGGGRDQTGFMVDGMVMVDERRNAPVMRVNLSSIKEIEILTGGFNAEYGNIRSGLLNVITKEGDQKKYSGSVDVRYSPAARKHFGNEYWVKEWGIYAGPNSMDATDDFDGWKALAEVSGENPEEMMALWKWRHRPVEYGNKPDYIIDASFSGPVPLLSKFIPTSFFLSYRPTYTAFVMPMARDGITNQNIQLSINSELSKSLRLSIYGLYGQLNTMHQGEGESTVSRNNYGAMSYRSGSMKYSLGADCMSDQYTSMAGFKLTHTLSPSTFYDVKLQRFWVHDFVTPQALRDTTKNNEYYPGSFADEGPFGWWPSVERDQLGIYMMARGGKQRDYSTTETITFKADLTSQINNYNQIKTGVEFVYNELDEYSGVYAPYHNNTDNWYIWNRFPKRGGAYIQDKLEWEGLIANFGVRLDYSDADVNWYTKDPYSKYFSESYVDSAYLAPTEQSKSRIKISPRLGISHPISENTKIFFNYGHFHSMPRNESLYAYQIGERGSKRIVQLGNPSLDIPRTVSYELGYDQNLFDQILLHVAGYYKDVTDQAKSVKYLNRSGSVNYNTYENNNYADIRGFEIRAEKKYGEYWWAWANYNYVLSSNGYIGYDTYYEDPRLQPQQTSAEQFSAVAQPTFRASIDFHTPLDWGPVMLGTKPFGGLMVNLLYNWQEGSKFTWEPIDPEIKNNMQWVNYSNMDLRVTKRFDSFFGLNSEFFLIVNNLFNQKRMNRWAFEGNEWQEYLQSMKLPWYEGEFKGDDKVGEHDKDYLDVDVNQDHLLFLNPRDIYVGFRLYF